MKILSMVLLRWLLFTLTFFELIFNSDAMSCPKGQRLERGKVGCVACSPEFYQPEENKSQRCKVCRWCNRESGSFVIEKCTRETNTICQCREGFVASETDSSTCKCDKGYGKKNGECSKCEDGYFSNRINSPCQKWKTCNAGVNITGTPTSDAVCNDESKTHVSTTPASHLPPSITHLTSKRSPKGAETQKDTTRNPSFVTSVPVQGITPELKVQPRTPSHTGSNFGIILPICVIALLTLTAVICKMYMTPRRKGKPPVEKHDSLCRTPVEETVCPLSNSIQESPEEKLTTCQLIL